MNLRVYMVEGPNTVTADGLDVSLSYDPTVLQPIDTDAGQPGIQAVTNAGLFSQSVFTIDQQNGIVRLSMYALPNEPAKNFATPVAFIPFRVIASGAYASAVHVNFSRYGTAETCVTHDGTDVNTIGKAYDLLFGSQGKPKISVNLAGLTGSGNWTIGLEQQVQWTSTNYSGDVSIDLSRDGGVTWESVTPRTANTGSYRFVPSDPATGPDQGLIRVSAAGVPEIYGQSVSFALVLPALPSPADLTATVIGDDSIQLSWRNRSNPPYGFYIERKTPGGDWESDGFTTGDHTTYVDVAFIEPNTTYTYRIQALDVHENLSLYSNEASATTVAAPDAYEPDDTAAQAHSIPTDGTLQHHTFHRQGDVDYVKFTIVAGAHVSIETLDLTPAVDTVLRLIDPDGRTVLDYDDNYGNGFASLIRHNLTRPGTYYARVEDTRQGSIGHSYDLRVTATSIPSCKVTSPNGGENWRAGTQHDITWQSANAGAAVNLDISRDGGSTWASLAAGAPNTGRFTWTVTDPSSTATLVRITDAGDPTSPDTSDSAFTIEGGAVGTGTGLCGTYYRNIDLTGAVARRLDSTINFDWGSGSPVSGTVSSDQFSVRWTGQIEAQYSENYLFHVHSDDGVRVWVNGAEIVDEWKDQVADYTSAPVRLQAGQKYDIKVEYYEHTGGASVKLEWESPSTERQVVPQTQLYGTVTPLPALVGLTCPAKVKGGKQLKIGVNLSGPAPDGGIDVDLGSSSTLVQVPTPLLIAAGSSSGTTRAKSKRPPRATAVTLTATYVGAAKTGKVRLTR